jgi:hypothetical protein
MASIFLAAPTFVSLPGGLGPDQTAISHTWQAWDGTVWDLSSGRSGVYLKAGVRGMTMPTMIRYTQKSPAVAGSIYRGTIPDERDVLWPLKVFRNSGSQDWINHNRAFWRTMHPEKTGTWVVTQPGGEYRTLTCRFVDDGQFAWAGDVEVDPELAGFANYGISLVAEQPYWQGAPISINWSPAASRPFFSTSGSVFGISSSNAVFGARISNPGSVDAWPVWTVRGPFTSATVGVGNDTVTLPFTVAAGHWVQIDTDPTVQTAFDDLGVDRTPDLGSVDFAQVPPGDPSDLNVTMAGSGSVDVTITPSYYTATAN